MELLHQVVATEEAGDTVAVVVDTLIISGRSNNWSRKYGSLDLNHQQVPEHVDTQPGRGNPNARSSVSQVTKNEG